MPYRAAAMEVGIWSIAIVRRWYNPLPCLPIQSHISNWLTQMNCHPSIPLLHSTILLLQKVCTTFSLPPTKLFTPYPLREHKGFLPQLHYQVKDKSKHASPTIACSLRQPICIDYLFLNVGHQHTISTIIFFLTLSFYCVFFYTSSQVRCIFQYIHLWMYFFSNFIHF